MEGFRKGGLDVNIARFVLLHRPGPLRKRARDFVGDLGRVAAEVEVEVVGAQGMGVRSGPQKEEEEDRGGRGDENTAFGRKRVGKPLGCRDFGGHGDSRDAMVEVVEVVEQSRCSRGECP